MAPQSTVIEAHRVGPPFAVGVLAVLGLLPLVAIVDPLAETPRWLAVAAVVGVGVGSVGLATLVGALLARDVDLQALANPLTKGPRVYRGAVAVGVGVALVTTATTAVAAALGGDPVRFDVWAGTDPLGLVVSVAASVVTELLLRFGVMTLVVWLAWTTRPAVDRGVPRGAVWAGVLVAATAGGVAAASTAFLVGAPLVELVVAAVTPVGGGVAFGWLYWRADLASAVVAHVVASFLRALVSLL